MIKVNLIQQKKAVQLPIVLGLDLNKINLRGLIVVLLLYKIPGAILGGVWEGEIKEQEAINTQLRQQLANFRAKTAGQNDLPKQIDGFLKQEKELTERLNVVKEVLKSKRNPWKILHYVAQNIPKKVWINKLKIEDGTLTIEGESSSYKSIGIFLESLQSSIFFESGAPKLISSETISNRTYQVRTQYFSIEGKIQRYN